VSIRCPVKGVYVSYTTKKHCYRNFVFFAAVSDLLILPFPGSRSVRFYKRGTSAGTIQLWSGVSAMCVCVCHKSEFCRNGCVNRAGFLPSIVHCVKRKFGYLQKVGVGHSSGTLSQNSGLGKFRFGIFIVEACYRLSSTRWTL